MAVVRIVPRGIKRTRITAEQMKDSLSAESISLQAEFLKQKLTIKAIRNVETDEVYIK